MPRKKREPREWTDAGAIGSTSEARWQEEQLGFRRRRDACTRPDCIICRDTHDFQRGVRAAVALVREAAALYASHEGTSAEVASDYPSRVALDSAASNIELTLLLPGEHKYPKKAR